MEELHKISGRTEVLYLIGTMIPAVSLDLTGEFLYHGVFLSDERRRVMFLTNFRNVPKIKEEVHFLQLD